MKFNSSLPLCWIMAIFLGSTFLFSAALAQTTNTVRLDYVYVTHDPAITHDQRERLMAPWKAEITRNTRDFTYAPSVSKHTGHAPAFLLTAQTESVTVTILSSLTTCENTGSTSEEPLCAAKIIADGKIVQTRSCFVEAVFGPLPGENTGNTFTAFSVDPAKRTVTIMAVRKGRAIAKCRRSVRY